MAIDQVVDVQISRQTTVPSQVGFGTAAYLCKLTTLTAPAVYGSLSEVMDAAKAGQPLENANAVDFATAYFGQQLAPEKLTIIPWGDGEAAVDEIAAGIDENNDWYALAIDSQEADDIAAVSDLIQGLGGDNPKLFFAQTADANVLVADEATNPAAVALSKNNDRTVVAYHSDANEQMVAAWLGTCLPEPAGSVTWAFKTLSTVVVDKFTKAQLDAAFAKKANIYQEIAAVKLTNNGTSAGEYIDVMRGVDFLKARVAENLFAWLVQQPKVPFTDASVTTIKANVADSLRLGVENDIIVNVPEVTAPAISALPASFKANRTLPDVKWEATLSGAIQKVIVRGVVTL